MPSFTHSICLIPSHAREKGELGNYSIKWSTETHGEDYHCYPHGPDFWRSRWKGDVMYIDRETEEKEVKVGFIKAVKWHMHTIGAPSHRPRARIRPKQLEHAVRNAAARVG